MDEHDHDACEIQYCDFSTYDKIHIQKREKPKGKAMVKLGSFSDINQVQDCKNKIQKILNLRQKYIPEDNYKVDCQIDHSQGYPEIKWDLNQQPSYEGEQIEFKDGVYQYGNFVSINEYIDDMKIMFENINDRELNSFCFRRMKYLEQKFKMHEILNHEVEANEQKKIKNRDFYSILKVDVHVHHSQCMSGKMLLDFMKEKFETDKDKIVYKEGQQQFTLKQVYDQMGIKLESMSLDTLDVMADKKMYKRFDRLFIKSRPLGEPILREIFLKINNFSQGQYIADLSKKVISNLNENGYVYVEWRVSIYGKSEAEWNKFAEWVYNNNLINPKVRYVIQVPRSYKKYKEQGILKDFQDTLNNIFRPLFNITVNPKLNEKLYQVLFSVCAFDLVSDESTFESFQMDDLRRRPQEWTSNDNPQYCYYMYYIFANLRCLNNLRKHYKLNTFQFKPHCGEAGSVDHLISGYFMSEAINHGLVLEKSQVVKYLFYLQQIGIAMSPVSNNRIFCRYQENPFRKYFFQGLNVTLSTSDPLVLHLTDDPLLEEYAIAAQLFNFSQVDLAELARNSVRMSSFEWPIKEYWLGKDYQNRFPIHNNYENNVVPMSRFLFRAETLKEEWELIQKLN